ncbi:GTPase Era [Chlorella sorokiniana]|uniref:GTPase Era n=1 Tax=Chlorella sorokiniana TaxID=3076 RepID=A0A2P6TJC6_CHLSO|nr:GTPase Era [Chlorella sorokiniana]|eukprot:PRW39350.1 GTPase Era [Chlorella sorokiniana]
MAAPSSAGDGQAPSWAAVPDAAVGRAFQDLSSEAADTLEALKLVPGEHVLHEDVPEVLSRASGRPLSGADAAAVLRCFTLDAGAAMSSAEFWASWRALQQLGARAAAGQAAGSPASRKTGALQQPEAPATTQPATAAAEMGWLHAAVPLPPRQRCDEAGGRYLPLRTTDVTKGGEGRSTTNQFGMYL